ncbi:hypothetical protein OXX59_006675 [Metschnikowia pulcherrima]
MGKPTTTLTTTISGSTITFLHPCWATFPGECVVVDEKQARENAGENGSKGSSSRVSGGAVRSDEKSRASGGSQNGGVGQAAGYSAGIWALIIVLMSCAAVLAESSVVCLV